MRIRIREINEFLGAKTENSKRVGAFDRASVKN
jgi:hypothetical protein